MKIEVVDSLYSEIFGNAEIHLNKAGVFSLKLTELIPEEYKYDTLPSSNTLDEIRKMCKEFCENCIRQKFMAKRYFCQ